MNDSEYIQKVLKHISGKTRKMLVKEELFDHLDEKEHYFKALGYDEIASKNKADEAMGNADLVGEQLELSGRTANKSKTFIYIFSGFSLLLTIGAYILLSTTDISGILSSHYIPYCYGISPLFSFCMFSAVFVLGAINLLIGIKKKNFVSLITGFIICETIIIIGPYHYCDLIQSIANNESYIDSFYMQSAVYLMPQNIQNEAVCYITASLSAIFVFLVFAFSLITLIKTKLLKNTKKDLKIKSVLAVLISVIAVFWLIISIIIVSLTTYNKNAILNRVSADLKAVEKEIITEIDSFTDFDIKNSTAAMIKAVNNSGVYFHHEDKDYLWDQYWTNDFIYIENHYYEDENGYKNLYFNVRCEIMNPFGFSQKSYNVYTEEKSNSTNINDIPLPAEINFDSSEDKTTICFIYDSDSAFDNETLFIYDYTSSAFVLDYDINTNFVNSKELTNNQKNILRSTLKELSYVYEEGFSNEALKLGEKGKFIWFETYSVYQSERINNLYKIDLSYTAYDIQLNSDNKKTVTFESGAPILGASIIISFNDESAEIIKWCYPEDYEYSDIDELIETLNRAYDGLYSNESISKLKDSNPTDLEKLKNKIINDYNNRFS